MARVSWCRRTLPWERAWSCKPKTAHTLSAPRTDGTWLLANGNAGVATESRQQAHHGAAVDGNAASGGGKARFGQMEKNGAAAVLTARALVVNQNEHDIIHRIFPPQAFVAGGKGQLHRAVVAAMARPVAPAKARRDWARWEAGARARQSIRPPKRRGDFERAARGYAIAFAFYGADSAGAERAGQGQAANLHMAVMPAPVCNRRPHAKPRQAALQNVVLWR